MRLSKNLASLKASKTLAITARAATLRASGVDVISFGAGEPDFDTPQFVKDGAAEAAAKGQTRYTATEGTLALRQAVCSKLQRENGLTYTPGDIVVSCGAKHSLFNALAALFDPGDEVVVPAPYWVSYIPQLRFLGVKPVVVESHADHDFCLTGEALQRVITPATRGMILNSPGNPTGTAYERSQLEDLAKVVLDNDLAVVSDEIYEHLVYDGYRHVSIASLGQAMQERTVVINGVSKAYAMTGWRIGYAAAPRHVAVAMGRFQGHITSCASSISQAAAQAALEGDNSFMQDWVVQFEARRRRIVELLNEMPGVECSLPKGAFYVFPSIEGILGRRSPNGILHNSADVSQYLLEEAKIAVVSGSAFGAEGYVRLSYATSMDRIEEGMVRMKDALLKLE